MAFNDPRWADVTQSIVGAIAGPDPMRRAQSEAYLGQASQGYAAADLDRQTRDFRERQIEAIIRGNTAEALAVAGGLGGTWAQHNPAIIAGRGVLPDADITPEIASQMSAVMGVQDMQDTPVGFEMDLAGALQRTIAGRAGRGGGGGAVAPSTPYEMSPTERMLFQAALAPFTNEDVEFDPRLTTAALAEVSRLAPDIGFAAALERVIQGIEGEGTPVDESILPFGWNDTPASPYRFGAAPVDPTQAPGPVGGNEDVLAQARAAIAAGANREQVIARLRANNIDPAGL